MSDEHDLEHYQTIAATAFTPQEREAVYRAIHERRDMRHFAGGVVADDVLLRLLRAAHHAPSVGFMQPWRFIRIRSLSMRESIHALVEQERLLTAQAMGVRQEDFMQLKVQGVLDAAEVLIVALPPGREAHVFGRRTMPEMDLASAACAIQNLWLAARAEGLGLGWVSIYDPQALAQLLQMPEGSYPLAVLCLGPVPAYYAEPMLQQEKWALRAPLQDMLFDERWGQAAAPVAPLAETTHVVEAPVTVAVVAYPNRQHLAEFDTLARAAGVRLEWVTTADALANVDCVVLPDSSATVEDLAWLRSQGLDAAIVAHAQAGQRVWGVGAGLAMLGEALIDDREVAGNAAGLGLLPVATLLSAQRPSATQRQRVQLPALHGAWSGLSHQVLAVQEGMCAATELRPDMEAGQQRCATAPVPGWLWQSAQGHICATYWRGLCAHPQWVQALSPCAQAAGEPQRP